MRPNYPIALAALVLQYTAFTAPVLVPNRSDGGGGGNPVAPAIRLQYQATTAPLGNTTIAPDKWAPRYPDRIYPKPDTRIWTQAVWPVVVPDLTVSAPILSWQPTYPDRVVRRTLPAAQQSTVVPTDPTTPPEPPPLEQWRSVYPSRLVRPPTIALYTMPQYYFGVIVQVPVESWTGNGLFPDRVLGFAPRIAGTQVWPLFIPGETNPAPVRSWAPSFPDRVFPARRLAAALNVGYMVTDPTTPTVSSSGFVPRLPLLGVG